MKTLKLASLVALFGFAALAVQPASATEWTYYAKGATGNPTTVACISDGNWALQVTSLDAETGTITFGAGSEGEQARVIKKGEGVLDLRGTLVTIDGVAYAKKAFSREACRKYANITEFYANGVTEIGAGMFLQCSSLEKVSIAGTATSIPDPAYSSNSQTGTFACCPKLTSAVFDLPNLTYIGKRAFHTEGSSPSTLTEITFSATGAVEVGEHAFIRVPLTSVTFSGTAWTKTNLGRLLDAYDTNCARKNKGIVCTFYANPAKGWDGKSDGKADWTLATATEAESASKPEKCIGVYCAESRKTSTTATSAWVVKNSAPAFLIIVR